MLTTSIPFSRFWEHYLKVSLHIDKTVRYDTILESLKDFGSYGYLLL